MRIGIPKEIKIGETRVAVSPEGVRTLIDKGHTVYLQHNAGQKAGWPDKLYCKVGARLVRDLSTVYRQSDLICKVKEVQTQEIPLLRSGQVLFTFLHLAGKPRLLKALCKKKIVAIAYETVETADGRRPILNAMSEIAGRVAGLIGANYLRKDLGGKGKLIAAVAGSAAATVGIIGCGHVGLAALESLRGLGADIIAVDKNPQKLDWLRKRYAKNLSTLPASTKNLHKLVRVSDLLIGAVLVPGRRAPHIVTEAMVKEMEVGSVIVDVAIDQGGCVATSRPSTIEKPIYRRHGVLHCAIPNLPALVPQTASPILAARVLPYLQRLANEGWESATTKHPALAKGLNLVEGKIVHPGLL